MFIKIVVFVKGERNGERGTTKDSRIQRNYYFPIASTHLRVLTDFNQCRGEATEGIRKLEIEIKYGEKDNDFEIIWRRRDVDKIQLSPQR